MSAFKLAGEVEAQSIALGDVVGLCEMVDLLEHHQQLDASHAELVLRIIRQKATIAADQLSTLAAQVRTMDEQPAPAIAPVVAKRKAKP